MRLSPPAAYVGRTTTSATELGRVALGEREKVFVLVGAANRDPRKWERPDEFDVTRAAGGQLAFGLGPHFCVGHAVARLESEVVLTALLDRVERIELAGDPEPELNNWLLGLRHLPVSVTPRIRDNPCGRNRKPRLVRPAVFGGTHHAQPNQARALALACLELFFGDYALVAEARPTWPARRRCRRCHSGRDLLDVPAHLRVSLAASCSGAPASCCRGRSGTRTRRGTAAR